MASFIFDEYSPIPMEEWEPDLDWDEGEWLSMEEQDRRFEAEHGTDWIGDE